MPFIQVVHGTVQGRARYKVAGLYRSESLKKYLEWRLETREEIRKVSVSLLTGNVLVLYNSDRPYAEVASLLEEAVVEFWKDSKPGNGGPSANDDLHLAESSLRLSPRNRETSAHQKLPVSTLKHNPKDNFSQSIEARSSKPVPTARTLRKSILQAMEQKSESWHCMDTQAVISRFGADRTHGLSSTSVEESLKRYGPNILPESVPRSRWTIFVDQFRSLPVALLGGAAVISIATGGVLEAVVIMGVVGINATIGSLTESQTEKIIHSLKTLVRPSALVKRNGQLKEVGAGDVVPGDLLILRPGSYVAADARLVEARHLSVDESALTGESMPVRKVTESLTEPLVPLADRVNMVYRGTLVTGGQGVAVVVATGKFTEIGSIQMLIGESKPPETPMERQLQKVGSQLVFLSGGICGAVFLIGLLRGYGFLQMLKLSISLAVAAVPEGLPAVATSTLALGIRNMQKHHALIRHLDAVETLGSVQTICLDKTGTLTLNRMSIASVCLNRRSLQVSESRFVANREEIHPYTCDELLKLIHLSVLCNESEVFKKNGDYLVTGSSTENALLHMAISAGVDVIALRERFPLLKINHRSENRNYMATLHRTENPGVHLLALKGSPLEVLSICSRYLVNGQEIPLGDEDRLAVETENQRMAGDALRVLGVAFARVSGDLSSLTSGEDVLITNGLTWVGLVGMGDPIRPGVKDLISAFHRTGIDTIMITGDQTPTAFAIGKELNLSRGDQLEILDSTHLINIDPEVMKALCERVHVFSRVTPAHKLQIVHALQKAGRVVAMTGDGINDGPALKAADIGVAMGRTGTDVAREVADVVLEDDNLQTMVVAISQGRTIYNNIRKTVHYLLATNLSEIMVITTATMGGLGQPLNVIQLLWINLISDIFPGLALALEPPEPDVLSQPPRDPNEPIIQTEDFKRIAFEAATLSAGALGAYGYGAVRYGPGPQSSTLAFMSLCMGQVLHALSCRSKQNTLFDRDGRERRLQSNRYLNLAVGGTLALQIAAPVVPGLRSLLGIARIGPIDGLVIGASAFWPLVVNEMTKGRSPRG
jgi:Ca2+-transporting ATPase